MSGLVDGRADPAFRAVREVFEASFADGQNTGAAVAAHIDGRPVVDLWGGIADTRTMRPWEHDTPAVTFSCTKAITATAALAVAHESGTSLDDPVTTWWPEYGTAGKAATTLADLLTHRAGLPAFDRAVSVAEAADPAAMAALLAGQRPVWEPGTGHLTARLRDVPIACARAVERCCASAAFPRCSSRPDSTGARHRQGAASIPVRYDRFS